MKEGGTTTTQLYHHSSECEKYASEVQLQLVRTPTLVRRVRQ